MTGRDIKIARVTAGMYQRDLAEKLGVTRQMVSKLERAQHITDEYEQRIKEACRVKQQ